MKTIKVYVQLGMTAEFATEFSVWSDAEKATCQNLANRMKAEVRAMRGNTVLARFRPQPTVKEYSDDERTDFYQR